MYSPNAIALATIRAAQHAGRAFTAEQRACIVRLLPSLSGAVWALAQLALDHYPIAVEA